MNIFMLSWLKGQGSLYFPFLLYLLPLRKKKKVSTPKTKVFALIRFLSFHPPFHPPPPRALPCLAFVEENLGHARSTFPFLEDIA